MGALKGGWGENHRGVAGAQNSAERWVMVTEAAGEQLQKVNHQKVDHQKR
jgi:hypothetical protein